MKFDFVITAIEKRNLVYHTNTIKMATQYNEFGLEVVPQIGCWIVSFEGMGDGSGKMVFDNNRPGISVYTDRNTLIRMLMSKLKIVASAASRIINVGGYRIDEHHGIRIKQANTNPSEPEKEHFYDWDLPVDTIPKDADLDLKGAVESLLDVMAEHKMKPHERNNQMPASKKRCYHLKWKVEDEGKTRSICGDLFKYRHLTDKSLVCGECDTHVLCKISYHGLSRHDLRSPATILWVDQLYRILTQTPETKRELAQSELKVVKISTVYVPGEPSYDERTLFYITKTNFVAEAYIVDDTPNSKIDYVVIGKLVVDKDDYIQITKLEEMDEETLEKMYLPHDSIKKEVKGVPLLTVLPDLNSDYPFLTFGSRLRRKKAETKETKSDTKDDIQQLPQRSVRKPTAALPRPRLQTTPPDSIVNNVHRVIPLPTLPSRTVKCPLTARDKLLAP